MDATMFQTLNLWLMDMQKLEYLLRLSGQTLITWTASKTSLLTPVNFPEDKMKSFVNTLSQEWSEIRTVLGSSSSYETYNRGMEVYVFIKRYGQPYLSEVWHGKVYYSHFLNPTAATFLA
ncbi:unnamed protein product [Eruca vesicaria subsp. sativa]|uniref:Uncharacterized protein n=1 Tax=Eruca vesicaria subsp. sativa TaxID=29727 RepID=A0ABC8KYU0_ERUVS|nr:unnamed protein product [Eruca vesicaria subsp. sativa]